MIKSGYRMNESTAVKAAKECSDLYDVYKDGKGYEGSYDYESSKIYAKHLGSKFADIVVISVYDAIEDDKLEVVFDNFCELAKKNWGSKKEIYENDEADAYGFLIKAGNLKFVYESVQGDRFIYFTKKDASKFDELFKELGK